MRSLTVSPQKASYQGTRVSGAVPGTVPSAPAPAPTALEHLPSTSLSWSH